jgi:hypothetical protein
MPFHFPNGSSSWPAPSRPDELRVVAALAFEDAERRLLADPEALQPHIVLVAWRITREIACRRGLVLATKETLSEMPRSLWRITDVERGKDQPPDGETAPDHARKLAHAVALRPTGEDSPEHAAWSYLVEFVAGYLGLPRRGPINAALSLLMDAPTQHWPEPGAIIDFEDQFLEAVARRLLRQPRAKVSKALQKTYGLMAHEANNLCALAARRFEPADQNKEAEKGLHLAKLEDFAFRMREAMHPREEFQALKEISSILGLKTPEKSATEEDMTDVIARVSGEKDANPARDDDGRILDVGPAE